MKPIRVDLTKPNKTTNPTKSKVPTCFENPWIVDLKENCKNHVLLTLNTSLKKYYLDRTNPTKFADCRVWTVNARLLHRRLFFIRYGPNSFVIKSFNDLRIPNLKYIDRYFMHQTGSAFHILKKEFQNEQFCRDRKWI